MVEIIAENRAARSLEIKEKFEAGLVLTGAEVKSCRLKQASLAPSFLRVLDGRVWLYKLHIGRYLKSGGFERGEEDRPRQVLLKKSEIGRIGGLLSRRGMVGLPLKLYIRRNLIKMEIGLGTIPRKWEKKRKLAERQQIRDTDRLLKGG